MGEVRGVLRAKVGEVRGVKDVPRWGKRGELWQKGLESVFSAKVGEVRGVMCRVWRG